MGNKSPIRKGIKESKQKREIKFLVEKGNKSPNKNWIEKSKWKLEKVNWN